MATTKATQWGNKKIDNFKAIVATGDIVKAEAYLKKGSKGKYPNDCFGMPIDLSQSSFGGSLELFDYLLEIGMPKGDINVGDLLNDRSIPLKEKKSFVEGLVSRGVRFSNMYEYELLGLNPDNSFLLGLDDDVELLSLIEENTAMHMTNPHYSVFQLYEGLGDTYEAGKIMTKLLAGHLFGTASFLLDRGWDKCYFPFSKSWDESVVSFLAEKGVSGLKLGVDLSNAPWKKKILEIAYEKKVLAKEVRGTQLWIGLFGDERGENEVSEEKALNDLLDELNKPVFDPVCVKKAISSGVISDWGEVIWQISSRYTNRFGDTPRHSIYSGMPFLEDSPNGLDWVRLVKSVIEANGGKACNRFDIAMQQDSAMSYTPGRKASAFWREQDADFYRAMLAGGANFSPDDKEAIFVWCEEGVVDVLFESKGWSRSDLELNEEIVNYVLSSNLNEDAICWVIENRRELMDQKKFSIGSMMKNGLHKAVACALRLEAEHSLSSPKASEYIFEAAQCGDECLVEELVRVYKLSPKAKEKALSHVSGLNKDNLARLRAVELLAGGKPADSQPAEAKSEDADKSEASQNPSDASDGAAQQATPEEREKALEIVSWFEDFKPIFDSDPWILHFDPSRITDAVNGGVRADWRLVAERLLRYWSDRPSSKLGNYADCFKALGALAPDSFKATVKLTFKEDVLSSTKMNNAGNKAFPHVAWWYYWCDDDGPAFVELDALGVRFKTRATPEAVFVFLPLEASEVVFRQHGWKREDMRFTSKQANKCVLASRSEHAFEWLCDNRPELVNFGALDTGKLGVFRESDEEFAQLIKERARSAEKDGGGKDVTKGMTPNQVATWVIEAAKDGDGSRISLLAPVAGKLSPAVRCELLETVCENCDVDAVKALYKAVKDFDYQSMAYAMAIALGKVDVVKVMKCHGATLEHAVRDIGFKGDTDAKRKKRMRQYHGIGYYYGYPYGQGAKDVVEAGVLSKMDLKTVLLFSVGKDDLETAKAAIDAGALEAIGPVPNYGAEVSFLTGIRARELEDFISTRTDKMSRFEFACENSPEKVTQRFSKAFLKDDKPEHSIARLKVMIPYLDFDEVKDAAALINYLARYGCLEELKIAAGFEKAWTPRRIKSALAAAEEGEQTETVAWLLEQLDKVK